MANSEAGSERLNEWFPVREIHSQGHDPNSLHNYLLFRYNPDLQQVEVCDPRVKRPQVVDLAQFHRKTL